MKIAETLPSDRRWRLVAWVGLVVVSAICLSRLAGFGLADPDEGRLLVVLAVYTLMLPSAKFAAEVVTAVNSP